MLYKVTPNLTPQPIEKPARDPNAPKVPRKRRRSAVYDANGNEVLITLMCLKCRAMKPLVRFGLRKMADGAIRNQPWCRPCRSVKKPVQGVVEAVETPVDAAELEAQTVEAPPPAEPEPAPPLPVAADAPI